MKKYTYEIIQPEELAAGIIGFYDLITITVDSGNPGDEPGEFEEFMRQALLEWYDGASVELIKIKEV